MASRNRFLRIFTHEGARARRSTPEQELRRSLMNCLLWEDQFYEDGVSIAERMAKLVPAVAPETAAALAVEAREVMNLRHAPLLIVREMARHPSHRGLVAEIGRQETPGHPRLFGTTLRFLQIVGLERIDDLPPIADGSALAALDEVFADADVP